MLRSILLGLALLGSVGVPVPLPGCAGPAGFGYDARSEQAIASCTNGKAAVIDAKRRRAFIPCGRDGTLSIIDLAAKGGARVIQTLPTAIGARSGAVDPNDGAVYLPSATFGAPDKPGGRGAMIAGRFRLLVVRPG